MTSSTALLIFVKHPSPGRVKTRLAQDIGEVEAAKVYRHFVEISLHRFQKIADCDRVVFFSPPDKKTHIAEWLPDQPRLLAQPDGGLGERLAYGFEALLKEYSKVIAIGTDSPSLPLAYIDEGIEALNQNDAAVGPTEDGGYYLIGLSQPAPKLFETMPWSTGQVMQKTIEAANASGVSMHILPEWHDIDWGDDLKRLRQCGIAELEELAAPYAPR